MTVEAPMVDWLESPGFGDRARRDGDATHVPPDAEAKLRSGERPMCATLPDGRRIPLDGPEPEHGDAGPMFAVVGGAAATALAATGWFGVMAACGTEHWSVAEVTAPIWGLALGSAAVALAVGIGCAVLDAYDAHRRARRS